MLFLFPVSIPILDLILSYTTDQFLNKWYPILESRPKLSDFYTLSQTN